MNDKDIAMRVQSLAEEIRTATSTRDHYGSRVYRPRSVCVQAAATIVAAQLGLDVIVEMEKRIGDIGFILDDRLPWKEN